MSGGRPSKGVLCPGNISGACTRSPRALLHFTTKIRKFHEISEARSVSASWLPQEAPVSQGSSNKLKHHPVLIQGQFLHAQKAPVKPPIKPSNILQPFPTPVEHLPNQGPVCRQQHTKISWPPLSSFCILHFSLGGCHDSTG